MDVMEALTQASQGVGMEGDAQVETGYGPDLVNQSLAMSQAQMTGPEGAPIQPSHPEKPVQSITLDQLRASRAASGAPPRGVDPLRAPQGDPRMDRLERMVEGLVVAVQGNPVVRPPPMGEVPPMIDSPLTAGRPAETATVWPEPIVSAPTPMDSPPENPVVDIQESITVVSTPAEPLSEILEPVKDDKDELAFQVYVREVQGLLNKKPQAREFFKSLRAATHRMVDPVNWSEEFSESFGRNFSKALTNGEFLVKVCRDLTVMAPGQVISPESAVKYFRLCCGYTALSCV